MAFFDFSIEELKVYRPVRNEPNDFDSFWQDTLQQVRQYPLEPRFELVDYGLRTLDPFDVTFHGYGGQPVKGWLLMPRQRSGKLPCVVKYIGYGGGRGFPTNWLAFPSAGFAFLVMDTRGQGSVWLKGDTPDIEPEGSNPQYPGFMTRGVLNPRTYYYRRVFSDAVRAVEAACSHPDIDPGRIAVAGGSQGGGISLATAGLSSLVKACLPEVPFLCHYRRATQLVDTAPYNEIANYCKIHPEQVETVFNTLSYFDGVNFATRAGAKALFSVGLMDDICPPSTVFAAYNHYNGPKEIRVYEFNQHDGAEDHHLQEQLKFLHALWG